MRASCWEEINLIYRGCESLSLAVTDWGRAGAWAAWVEAASAASEYDKNSLRPGADGVGGARPLGREGNHISRRTQAVRELVAYMVISVYIRRPSPALAQPWSAPSRPALEGDSNLR